MKHPALSSFIGSVAGLHPEPFLLRKAGQSFFNTSPLAPGLLLGDQDHIRQNLYA